MWTLHEGVWGLQGGLGGRLHPGQVRHRWSGPVRSGLCTGPGDQPSLTLPVAPRPYLLHRSYVRQASSQSKHEL